MSQCIVQFETESTTTKKKEEKKKKSLYFPNLIRMQTAGSVNVFCSFNSSNSHNKQKEKKKVLIFS